MQEYTNNIERVYTRLVNRYSDKHGFDGGLAAVHFWERAHTMRIHLRGCPADAVNMARATLQNSGDVLYMQQPVLWLLYRFICQADYITRYLPEAVITERDDAESLTFWENAYEVARV